ncbi:hypothetical protein SAMN05421736_1148 [Evansella caseinilytica]|uniref:Uncharacterized protein n=1 Tax=Evansella caseinilytica TaxID=1503961 RepID=A0A1H3TEM5_9BACI|nr:hypothetical protein SAMN05421736_1148 [Evansella caseinilytica]
MHSFQAGCEWFSRSQDGDIPPLPIGRGQHLGGIGRIVRNHCLFEHALKVIVQTGEHRSCKKGEAGQLQQRLREQPLEKRNKRALKKEVFSHFQCLNAMTEAIAASIIKTSGRCHPRFFAALVSLRGNCANGITSRHLSGFSVYFFVR